MSVREGLSEPFDHGVRNPHSVVGMDDNNGGSRCSSGHVLGVAEHVAGRRTRLPPPRHSQLLRMRGQTVPGPADPPHALAVRRVPSPLEALDLGVLELWNPVVPALVRVAVLSHGLQFRATSLDPLLDLLEAVGIGELVREEVDERRSHQALGADLE